MDTIKRVSDLNDEIADITERLAAPTPDAATLDQRRFDLLVEQHRLCGAHDPQVAALFTMQRQYPPMTPTPVR